MTNCEISNVGVACLLKLKTLRVLDLSDNKINNQGLHILSKHPNINELTLKEEHISYQGIKFFLKKKKKILKSFAYHGEQKNPATDNWVNIFSDCSVLTSLTLRRCGIGPKGTALLSKNKNLEHLDLSHNPVADKGARMLASHPRLNSLYLEDCKIGDRGITALAKNPRLKRLAISSNSGITCIGLLALALNNTITELDFNYEHLMTSKLVLFFLCNQTLRYCTPYPDSSYYCLSGFPLNENDPLIALGGRNLRLQNEYHSVVRQSFFAFTPLLPDLTDIVLEYTKGEYPSRYQLFYDHLTPEIFRKIQQEYPEANKKLVEYQEECKFR